MADILSIGIDIGTSTTKVVFSCLTMENTAGYFSVPNISIVDKKVIYKSAIHLTPLATPLLIDGDGVRRIVEHEFNEAGFTPADIDTGAVIITGESARKENTEIILQNMSDFAGDFVVSTAGPDIESVIAGKGSGAYQYSLKNKCTTVNLDIGGGTTNIVMFDNGEVVAKGCLDIGGRLIRITGDMIVESISNSAAAIAQEAGIGIGIGKKTTLEDLKRITDMMAALILQFLSPAPPSAMLSALQTKGSTWFEAAGRQIDFISFSGGVADSIYQSGVGKVAYGDIGVLLGESIRQSDLFNIFNVIRANETIRATVVGAGIYTTSVSGSTITYTRDVFPLKNIPVLKLSVKDEQECFEGGSKELCKQTEWFLRQNDAGLMILAMTGKKDVTFPQLKKAAAAIAGALDRVLAPGAPIIIVLECDIAKALGLALCIAIHGSRDIIALDSIHVDEDNYLDLGRPLMDGLVIPVVVKTLIFG